MIVEDLTPEMQEKAKACKTAQEVLALAQEIGADLTEEQLATVSGGASWCSALCVEHEGCSYYNTQT